MIRRIVKPMFSEGVMVGLVRMGLAALYGGIRSAAVAGPVMALVFITIYAFALGDWHEAAITAFAPDRSLWDAEPGLGWRCALTVCRLAGAWFFLIPAPPAELDSAFPRPPRESWNA